MLRPLWQIDFTHPFTSGQQAMHDTTLISRSQRSIRRSHGFVDKCRSSITNWRVPFAAHTGKTHACKPSLVMLECATMPHVTHRTETSRPHLATHAQWLTAITAAITHWSALHLATSILGHVSAQRARAQLVLQTHGHCVCTGISGASQ